MNEDVRYGVLLVVSLAGMCWSLERITPGSLWFTVPMSLAGLVLMMEKGA